MDPRLEATRVAYDAASADYQQHWRGRRPFDAVRKFAALAGRGARVLDLASGPALDVRLLRDAGLKVVAGDLSHESMRVARTLHPKGSLARWDYRRLPFADDTFDGLWAPAALQHVPRNQVRATLREWRRVQRRGPFFLTMREGNGDLEAVEDPPAGTVYATSVTADELKTLLLAEGWVEVEVEPRPDPLERSGITWLHAFGQLRAGG
jgi:ubiquinone/menaquinone biosynthesis C-methylase UbiE